MHSACNLACLQAFLFRFLTARELGRAQTLADFTVSQGLSQTMICSWAKSRDLKKQREKKKKKSQTGICRIWKCLPGDQRQLLLGNGVLMSDRSLINVDHRILNVKYLILTSDQVLRDPLRESDYRIEFCRYNWKSEPKKHVRLLDIVQDTRFERKDGWVLVALDTKKVEKSMKSVADRAFSERSTWKEGEKVYCYSVAESTDSFNVELDELTCVSNSECGLVIDPAPRRSPQLGSLILDSEAKFLGVLGDCNGNHVIHTIAGEKVHGCGGIQKRRSPVFEGLIDRAFV